MMRRISSKNIIVIACIIVASIAAIGISWKVIAGPGIPEEGIKNIQILLLKDNGTLSTHAVHSKTNMTEIVRFLNSGTYAPLCKARAEAQIGIEYLDGTHIQIAVMGGGSLISYKGSRYTLNPEGTRGMPLEHIGWLAGWNLSRYGTYELWTATEDPQTQSNGVNN